MAIWTGAADAMATLAQQVATLSTETQFPELGFDCVLHVLRYLPLYDGLQLATVSSDWKSAANSRLAEQKILNLSYASGSVDSSLVSWLLGRMPRVCCLVLNDCVDVTLSAVSGTVFSLMARLETIDVSGTAIDAHAFFELWSLPAIFELHVSGCPRLVEMEMCQHARPASSSLLKLDLSVPRLTGGVRFVPGAPLQLLILDVSGYETMPTAVVSVIAHSCRCLTKILLAECEQLDDAAVTQLASNCPNLRDVALSWCGGSNRSRRGTRSGVQENGLHRPAMLHTRAGCPAAGYAGVVELPDGLNLNRCDCTGTAPLSGGASPP